MKYKRQYQYCDISGIVKDTGEKVSFFKEDDILFYGNVRLPNGRREIKIRIMSRNINEMLSAVRTVLSKFYPEKLFAEVLLRNGFESRMRIPENKFILDKDKLLLRKISLAASHAREYSGMAGGM